MTALDGEAYVLVAITNTAAKQLPAEAMAEPGQQKKRPRLQLAVETPVRTLRSASAPRQQAVVQSFSAVSLCEVTGAGSYTAKLADERSESMFPGSQISNMGSQLCSHSSVDSQLSTSSIAGRRSFSLPSVSVDISMHQQPQQPQQRPLFAPHFNTRELELASQKAKATHGWFARCRGCAQFSGHEMVLPTKVTLSAALHVPMCAVCTRHMAAISGAGALETIQTRLMVIHSHWLEKVDGR